MILCDTGPLVALLNRNDPMHLKCSTILPSLRPPLVTTQACVTEAMYLLGRDTGSQGQHALWTMIDAHVLTVAELDEQAMQNAKYNFERFADIPCDYADSTLIALAIETQCSDVFTLDKHFYAYRLPDGSSLNVVP